MAKETGAISSNKPQKSIFDDNAKYNLTIWQRIGLPFLWVYWVLYQSPTKKTWHEVKKGMEKHECKFTIPHNEGKYKFLSCEHEGCNIVDPVD